MRSLATNSRIEWTEVTWNPVTGCDRVAAGCDNCYALALAKRLKAAGVAKARGFATNVSNFQSTKNERAYAAKVSKALGKLGVKPKNRHYVIDTARNGRATAGAQWCNPPGQGLGVKPRWVGGSRLDAYLWVKRPGESDGTCNGGPAAGTWWTEYALGLVDRRSR